MAKPASTALHQVYRPTPDRPVLRQQLAHDAELRFAGPDSDSDTINDEEAVIPLYHPETLLVHPLPSDAKHVADILCHHDRQFLQVAYINVLGRNIDESGMANYLGKLRSGECDKAEILGRLMLSREGRERSKKRWGGWRIKLRLVLNHLPVIGGVVGWLKAIVRLPRMLRHHHATEAALHGMLRDTVDNLEKLRRESVKQAKNLDQQNIGWQQLNDDVDDIANVLEPLKSLDEPRLAFIDSQFKQHRQSQYPAFSAFYLALENRFRGSAEEINRRFEQYSHYLKLIREDDRIELPKALDLGCGRGEWLSFVAQHGYTVTGIDNNPEMAKESGKLPFDFIHGDILEQLQTLPDDCFSFVTAFHVVEHLPSGYLLNVIKEIWRILEPGGGLLFETPNPENLIVGSSTFYIDPTHLQPVPPPLLKFMLEYHNYLSVEVHYANPSTDGLVEPQQSKAIERINNSLFGCQDYAVWGRK